MKQQQELIYLQLDQLQPYERNARVHDSDQLGRLRASLLSSGWGSPILARGETHTIICGHARYLVAQMIAFAAALVRGVPNAPRHREVAAG